MIGAGRSAGEIGSSRRAERKRRPAGGRCRGDTTSGRIHGEQNESIVARTTLASLGEFFFRERTSEIRGVVALGCVKTAFGRRF